MKNSNKREQKQNQFCVLLSGSIFRKRIVVFLILCLALSGQVHAQRYLPGQKGIQVTAGAVDGFNFTSGEGQAFCFGTALSTYTKNGNRWLFGGEYLQKSHLYKDLLIPVSQMTAEGGYFCKVLSDPNKILFFSLGISALGGYETVNWGNETLYDGSTIENSDNFIYGGAATFEVEAYLTDKTVLLLNARERILPSSSINKFHFQLSVGIKVIIN